MWIIAFFCVLPSIIDGKLGFGDQKEIGSKNDKLLVILISRTTCFMYFVYYLVFNYSFYYFN